MYCVLFNTFLCTNNRLINNPLNDSNFMCACVCESATTVSVCVRSPLLCSRECGTWLHIFFYRQLHFQSQPGSCLAISANGLETEGTPLANICLNDFSQSGLSFGNKISMRNQIFRKSCLRFGQNLRLRAKKLSCL